MPSRPFTCVYVVAWSTVIATVPRQTQQNNPCPAIITAGFKQRGDGYVRANNAVEVAGVFVPLETSAASREIGAKEAQGYLLFSNNCSLFLAQHTSLFSIETGQAAIAKQGPVIGQSP